MENIDNIQSNEVASPAPANIKQSRKTIAIIALAISVYLIIASGLQIAFATLAQELMLDVKLSTDVFMFLLVSFPQYAIALPVAYLIIRKLPKTEAPRSQLKPLRFLGYCVVAFALMYIGNLIGTGLMPAYDALTGTTSIDVAAALVTQTSPLFNIIAVAMLAPIFEELLFRKLIMDRLIRFGELNACIFSALTFALFHGNFFQFFYAFGIGLVLAYIYVKTRNLIYPVLIHALINLMGSVVSLAVVNSENTLVIMIYGYLLVFMLAFGIALLIINRKNISFAAGELSLGKERTKTLYFNVGMILFYVLCIAMFAINLGLIVT